MASAGQSACFSYAVRLTSQGSIFCCANRHYAARPPPMPGPRPLHTSQRLALLQDLGRRRRGALLPCCPVDLPRLLSPSHQPSLHSKAISDALVMAPPHSQRFAPLRICTDEALDGVGRSISLLLPWRAVDLPGQHFLSRQPLLCSKATSDAWAMAPPHLPAPCPPPGSTKTKMRRSTVSECPSARSFYAVRPFKA